jgi:hydroxyacylglutathione hydrolase
MQLTTIVSEGLAHRAYVVSDAGEAAVIDPGRDIDRCLEAAANAGCRIIHIFETHRNEDYISGASELSQRTGALVWRGKSPDFNVPYARTISPEQRFEFGELRLTALQTPGHTDDSISIVLTHLATGDSPVGVFTGDALFVGDVGRTDFYPDRAEAVAGLLFDSLHEHLLPLGDQTIIYPAHGAGSVCGSGVAKRDFSTIGEERANNPRLQLDRAAFIAAKTAEHHYIPPYFARMEAANMGGPPELGPLPMPQAMSVKQVRESMKAGAQLLDLRGDQAIAGACIAEAIAVPLKMLASFGGWFLKYDCPIVLLLENPKDLDKAVRTLVRIGYDRIEGFVGDGFEVWSSDAQPLECIEGIDVHELKRRLASGEPPLLIDVRALDEYDSGHIDPSVHHYVGQIEAVAPEVLAGRALVTFCNSGQRALVAAAALRRLGHPQVAVCWGSMKAWKVSGYPVAGGQKT